MSTPHSERVLEHIAEHRPDVLLVGMGTPQQELWVDRHFDRLERLPATFLRHRR